LSATVDRPRLCSCRAIANFGMDRGEASSMSSSISRGILGAGVLGAAPGFERTGIAVALAGAVEPGSVLGDGVRPVELHQLLALRAGVAILLRIEDEVGLREGDGGHRGALFHQAQTTTPTRNNGPSRRTCRRDKRAHDSKGARGIIDIDRMPTLLEALELNLFG
jgi:hypothetical protein